LLGAFLQIVGIGCCIIFSVWSFLLGRLIYGIGCGFFFSSSFRYVEECSPPHLLSLFYTIYSFGISLNRPCVTLMAYLTLSGINSQTSEEVLLNTNAWRYFIGIPIFFTVIFIIGMLTLVRRDTPMYLITQQRYDEAKKSIAHFTSSYQDQ
jgi:MFS family permease